MPRDHSCFQKHRNMNSTECNECSESYSFLVTSFDEIAQLKARILRKIRIIWGEEPDALGHYVKTILEEGVPNAVEHGILGMGYDEKKELLEKNPSGYMDHVKKGWEEKGEPVGVSLCINGKRILLGFHDGGRGFDPSDYRLATAPKLDMLSPNGRGLTILREMGVKLLWNDEGNSMLCSLERDRLSV